MTISRKYALEQILKEVKQDKPNLFKISTANFSNVAKILLANPNITVEDANYMLDAYFMPYDEILNELVIYDISIPRIDELKFVNKLRLKYKVGKDTLFRRIKEIRKIYEYKKTLEKKSKQKVIKM